MMSIRFLVGVATSVLVAVVALPATASDADTQAGQVLVEEIRKRQSGIARTGRGTDSGLTWDVVESLPVSEDIKRQTGGCGDREAKRFEETHGAVLPILRPRWPVRC